MHWQMRYPSMLTKREEDTLSNAFCPSRAIRPPSPREPAGCNAPVTQVERRRASGREAAEALAGGQVPSLAGDKPGVFRSPSRRKGAGIPRCQEWDATSILSGQLSSSLPSHRGAQSCQTGTRGGQGQGDFTSCALLLARIAAGVSWAAWLMHPTESLQQPKPGGCKGLILPELSSWQDTTPKCLGSLRPSLGTLGSEQEKEKLQ